MPAAVVRAVLTSALCLAIVHRSGAQDAPKPPDPKPPPQAEADATTIKEVGGRLVVTGETVLVTANPDEPLRNSSIASKIDLPLLETPNSVSIIDRRALDDLSAVNITQAHDFTVGMISMDERGPAFARGFRVDFYDLRRDGVRTYAWSVREPVAVDRIQYLRGPASVLYGDGSPGGLVNLVLKKPLPTPRYEVSASGGGLGFGRVTADLTGPLTANRKIRYRFVAAAERFDGGFDNDERRLSVLPMVSLDISPRTTLHVDTEVYDQRGRGYRHTVPATADTNDGDFSRVPWDLNMASPDDRWQGSNVSPGLRLDSQLGTRTSLHVAARYTKIKGDLGFQGLFGLAPDGRTANRGLYREISEWDEYHSDTFVSFSPSTGRIEHRLVAGIEAGLSTTDSQIGIGPAPALDLFEPVYGPRPAAPATAPSRYDVLRTGFYARDQMRISDRVILAPALRWSRLRVEDRVERTGQAVEPNSTDAKLSPSVGLIVLPRRTLSLYTTYSQGFEPPTPGQYLEDGRLTTPVTNVSIEAGVKTEIARSRLAISGAVFRIQQQNVAEADPQGFYRQIGEGESHGVEVEVVGRLVTRLGVRGGYAWTLTEITQDTSGFAGRELPNAPRHKANILLSYQPDALSARLTVAGGLVHVSSRFTGRDNAVTLPAYTRIDASTFLTLAGPRLVLGLNAQNLANVRYVTSGAGRVLYAGSPRRIVVGVTSTF